MRVPGAGVLLSLALMLPACAPTREALLLDVQQLPADEVIAIVRAEETELSSFTGNGSVAFDSPEMSGSVFFTVAIRNRDSILVRFEGPFGLDAGFLFADRERFVLYNAMENWYTDGFTKSAGIRSVIPIDLSFDQLIDAFTGTFRLPSGRRPARYEIDDDRFLLVFPQGSDSVSYWIDPALRAVTRYCLAHGDSTLADVSTDRWEGDVGSAMPHHITMNFPLTSRGVSVFYSSVTVNPTVVSLSYSIPARARRHTLQ